MRNQMDENFFNAFFKSFTNMGLPDPRKDKEFRDSLIEALNALEEKETEVKPNTFEFSEIQFKRCLDILNSQWALDASKNKAANWILDAYEQGYIRKKGF